MRIAWGVILLFASRYIVQTLFDTRNNGDIWWQRFLGDRIMATGHLPNALGSETFTAPGAPWVPQEWALSVAVALSLHMHLFWLLAVLATAAGIGTLVITALSARRLGASQLTTAFCVLCAGFALVGAYGVRAQVFAWLFMAAFFYILRNVDGKGAFWLVPITVLWANIHASVMLAPVLAGIWTMGVLLEQERWSRTVRRLAVLTVLLALATLATPLGIRLPIYAASLLTSPIRYGIVEWQPADLRTIAFICGLLPLIIGLCLTGIGRRREIPLFLVLVWLAFSAVRNIPVCAILLAPVAASRLAAYLPERLRINQLVQERGIAVMAYACFIPSAVLITWNLARGASKMPGILPQTAMTVALKQPGMHRIYCEDWSWCSLALQHPNMRIFMDGRCDPFPLSVWHQDAIMTHVKPQWRTVVSKNRIDELLLRPHSKLERAVALKSDWRVIYADSRVKLFVKEHRDTAYQ